VYLVTTTVIQSSKYISTTGLHRASLDSCNISNDTLSHVIANTAPAINQATYTVSSKNKSLDTMQPTPSTHTSSTPLSMSLQAVVDVSWNYGKVDGV
jgi:hypothetical protein